MSTMDFIAFYIKGFSLIQVSFPPEVLRWNKHVDIYNRLQVWQFLCTQIKLCSSWGKDYLVLVIFWLQTMLGNVPGKCYPTVALGVQILLNTWNYLYLWWQMDKKLSLLEQVLFNFNYKKKAWVIIPINMILTWELKYLKMYLGEGGVNFTIFLPHLTYPSSVFQCSKWFFGNPLTFQISGEHNIIFSFRHLTVS